MPREGLEPTRAEAHWILNPARLPVSPPRRILAEKMYNFFLLKSRENRGRFLGKLKIPKPVKLICAVTLSEEIDYLEINSILEKNFGKIDLQSEIFNFIHTHYYEKEMGKELKKYYMSFAELISAEKTPEIKIKTNKIEKGFSNNNKRKINLDPGYIEKPKLILLSTKDFSHRIYLGSGIFGDLQYRMVGGQYQFNEWTYPDYKEEKVRHFFRRVRDRYCREVDKW